jgi:GTP:adenosylcobinamide-phosphate guanylyltransferase
MDAIVIAGGIPKPDDPLYDYTQGKSKALIDIAGKPMVQWVLDALSAAQKVETVTIIGLPEDSGITCEKPLQYLANQGSMLANIVVGIHKVLEISPQAEYMMVVSSDIPGINAEMIDWLVDTTLQSQDDIYYGIVKREVMEARYPGANRTFTGLADMHVCGADIHVAHKTMVTDPEHLAMWEELIGKRKSPLKQAASIGIFTLLLLLTGRLSLDDAIQRITKRLNITGRPIIWEYAEAAMDVDKPHQLELLRTDLS